MDQRYNNIKRRTKTNLVSFFVSQEFNIQMCIAIFKRFALSTHSMFAMNMKMCDKII